MFRRQVLKADFIKHILATTKFGGEKTRELHPNARRAATDLCQRRELNTVTIIFIIPPWALRSSGCRSFTYR